MLFELYKAIDPSLLIRNYYKFLKHDILFDTGPLFLYIIGSFDSKNETKLLEIFEYNLNDYKLLMKMIHLLKKKHYNFVITPHIFHELIKHIQDNCKKIYPNQDYCRNIMNNLSNFIKPILKEIRETKHAEKDILMEHPHFLGRLEIGDISIDIVDKKTEQCCMIFTDDKDIKEEYEDQNNREVLVFYFTDIKNNSFLF